MRKLNKSDDASYAIALSNLAGILKDQAKFGESEPLYDEALVLIEKLRGVESSEYATITDNLALFVHASRASRESDASSRKGAGYL